MQCSGRGFSQLGTDVENRVKWAKLKEHRARAAAFSLDILVWGPSDDGSPEYMVRCKIRDELATRGHNACFSEELCDDDEALKNTLSEEYIQAESADAIIVVYGSRGTQTERDKFLDYSWIAHKAHVVVSKEVLSNVERSVSSSNWASMARIAKIIKYEGTEELTGKVNEVCDEIDELRKELYVKRLEMSRRKVYG